MKQNRKITILHIALTNLKYQSFRTMILFVLLLVTTVALFLGDFLTESMSEGIAETSQRIGADIIVVPNTFVSSVENSLFLGKPCTVNFSIDWLDKISSVKGVKKVSSQLYISSLSADCCENSLQLIALDIHTDFTIVPWLSKDGVKSLKDNEIILGSNMKKNIGDTVKYFGRKFIVKDRLDETGMGYDNSAFISYEAAYKIANDPIYKSALPFQSGKQMISMVLLNIDKKYNLAEVKKNIENKYGKSDILVYSTSELLTKFSNNLENIKVYGNFIKVLFLILSATSLYAMLSIMIYLRRHEFGSMISVGVPRTKIIQMLVCEMTYIVVLASIIGIGIVCAVIIPFNMQIKSMFTIPYLLPSSGIIIAMSLKTFIVNLLVCSAASFQSFWKFSKIEAAELIKEENG
jgi:putative ABC transport system permease protein